MANLVFNIVSGALPVLVEIVELEYSLAYYEYGEHTIYGLDPGTYTLHCTDINGCEVTIENIIISVPVTTTTTTTLSFTTTSTTIIEETTTSTTTEEFTTSTTTEEPITTTTTTTCNPLKCDYGLLYNWYAVNTGKLAPTGWHVPSDTEWTTLTTYLGGEPVAGGKMKTIGTCDWHSPNEGATNESGFSGLPSGSRINTGSFGSIGLGGYWWSSTENSPTEAWDRYLLTYYIFAGRADTTKDYGFSVRCVRDYYEGHPPTIQDYDGNTYDVIEIGTQLWTVQNLKVTHYNDGEVIPNITDNTEWINLTTGALCAHNNDWETYTCVNETTTTTTTTTCVGPIITDQPDDEELCEGETAVFEVATSASEPTYQWQIYTGEEPPNDWADLSDDMNVSGAETSTLSISGVNAGYSGSILRCVVTAGGCSTPSDSATLTVNELLQYRSAATGDWEDADTWEKFDGTDWYPSSTYPGEITNDCPDPSCTIRDGHTVSVYNYIDYDFDSVIVEEGGELILYFLTTTTTTAEITTTTTTTEEPTTTTTTIP